MEVVAHAAILYFGGLVVGVMKKHGRRALGIVKLRVVHNLHIFLGVGRGHSQSDAQQNRDKKDDRPSHRFPPTPTLSPSGKGIFLISIETIHSFDICHI